MFPGLRQRFDAALDLIVEFSTLGEYRLAAPAAGVRASALVSPSGPGPRMGGAGGHAARAAEQQAAKGAVAIAQGAAVRVPLRGAAATPAARRLATTRRHVSSPADRRVRLAGSPLKPQRSRAGAPAVPEQLCLAV